MKPDDLQPVSKAISQLLAGPLTDPAAVHLAESGVTVGKIPYGFHCHDTWELFCPLQSGLQFVVAGRPPATIPTSHLLIVPPGCLHLSVDQLPQPRDLTLLVINLPGAETPYGGLSVSSGGQRSGGVLAPPELTAWTAIVGVAPGVMMDQVAQALEVGTWGRERALGLLRVLMAAYAEVISRPQHDRLSLDARRVAQAQLFLQSHYYEPTLSVETVAAAQGLSASHLGALFQKTTGHALHQTLIDLRLRRATDLLTRTTFSIKQIAAMTGWSNQLYFSAAYRRRHGRPPSAVRSGPGQPPPFGSS
jgi:AraC-like DNA-binding protein